MDLSGIKETLMAIFSWLAWSITNVLYTIYILEKQMDRKKIIAIVLISLFVWYIAWLFCLYFWVKSYLLNIIVTLCSYLWLVFLNKVETRKEELIDTLIDKSFDTLWKK
jgi:fatty acid desaturase